MKKTRVKNITMSDIAGRANVSLMTVSRVLNGRKGASTETRNKILKIAKQLNYMPDSSARSLVSGKSFCIALMIHEDPSSNYCSQLVSGVMKQCNKSDYKFLLEDFRFYNTVNAKSVLVRLKQIKVDGLILPEFVSNNKSFIKILEHAGIKHVRVCSGPIRSTSPCICIDNYESAFEITSYLISLGHRSIGFIKGRRTEHVSERRFNGFKDAITHHNIKLNRKLITQGDFKIKSGYQAAKKMLTEKNRPTAILASNDYMAAGVMKAAYSIGLHIPNDLSVAGFDNIELANMLSPALTTVNQYVEKQAAIATELLIHLIEKNQKDLTHSEFDKIIKHRILVRESTGKISL